MLQIERAIAIIEGKAKNSEVPDMELRVLNYFLMVAREENITKAAQLLHVTQPTLSRQLMQLEEELGVQLFHRGKHNVTLTEDGLLLRRRAQELVTLSEKTKLELQHKEEIPSGEIAIGCGEARSMSILSGGMNTFRVSYPMVQFSIHSAAADEIKERIEKGLLDMGLLTEPVDISKYEFIRMPVKDRWGILVRNDSPLAGKNAVTPDDLKGSPLIMVRRELVKNELASWFGSTFEQLEIAATYNLIVNAANMVEKGMGIALCFDLGVFFENLCFVPLSPRMETGTVLVWKKNQALTAANAKFIQHMKQYISGISQN